MKNFFTRNVFPISVLAAILLLRFGPFLFGKVLFFGDDFSLMVPSKLFTVGWIKQGIFPLWNPTVMGGVPWHGDINQSLLYLSTGLFYVLPPAAALVLNQVIHLAIGFVGIYTCARVWGLKQTAATLASVLWVMGMNMTGALNNFSILQSMVWVPWIVGSGIKLTVNPSIRTMLGVAVSVALLILGGYPQLLVYALAAAAVLSVWQAKLWTVRDLREFLKLARFWAAAGILGMGLSAVALLPFKEVLDLSTRVAQTQEQSAAGSVLPAELIKILVPSVFDNFEVGMRWGPLQSAAPNLIFYVGWMVLVLLAWKLVTRPAKTDVFLFVLTLLTIGFSLGNHFPGFEFIQQVLPVLRFSRGPGIVYVITSMFIALWAGSLFNQRQLPSKKFIRVCLIGGAVGTVLLLIALAAVKLNFSVLWHSADAALNNKLSGSPFHTFERDAVIANTLLSTLLVVVLGFALSSWALLKRNYRLFIWIVLLDLWLATKMLYVYAPASVYDFSPPSELVSILNDPQTRVLTRNYNAPYADFGTYYSSMAVRQPFTDSWIAEEELSNYTVLKQMRDALTPDWGSVINVKSLHGYITLVPLSADRYWNDLAEPRINNLPYIQTTDPRLQEWAVGYYLVDTWYPTYEEVLPTTVIAEGSQEPGDMWRLYSLPALPRIRYGSNEAVALQDYKEHPNRIEFSALVPDGEERIIIADRWDKNWQLYIDGSGAELKRTDSDLRTFAVTPGQHKITMRYRPQSFFTGLWITLGSVAVTVLVWLYGVRKAGFSHWKRV